MVKKRIVLDLDKDLCVDPSTDSLTVKVSQKEGNTLQIKNDGLYAESTSGENGSGGQGYTERSACDYVRVGYEHPYSNKIVNSTVHCTSVVHRTFDASIENDEVVLSGFRPIDIVLVGDFFRVKTSDDKYKYYIVTETDQGVDGKGLNNKVVSYEELGEV